MARNTPMWHLRFMDARNNLSKACESMYQAASEDRNNPTFRDFHKRLQLLLSEIDDQTMDNLKRVREGR